MPNPAPRYRAAATNFRGWGHHLALVCITVGDPERFGHQRDVAAHLGLVPKRDQPGSLDKQLRITKAGDVYLRRLLVGSAQYMPGPFGLDCDLKRRGLELAARGGHAAKQKAIVATARKLSVILLTLWKSGKPYQPLREAAPAEYAA